MDKAIRDKWIDALESGDYAQGHGQLCNCYNGEDRFCCLGVLCEVLDLPKKNGKEKYGNDPNRKYYLMGMDMGYDIWENVTLTEDLIKNLGMTTDEAGTLVKMNDGDRYGFPIISVWIRENL